MCGDRVTRPLARVLAGLALGVGLVGCGATARSARGLDAAARTELYERSERPFAFAFLLRPDDGGEASVARELAPLLLHEAEEGAKASADPLVVRALRS